MRNLYIKPDLHVMGGLHPYVGWTHKKSGAWTHKKSSIYTWVFLKTYLREIISFTNLVKANKVLISYRVNQNWREAGIIKDCLSFFFLNYNIPLFNRFENIWRKNLKTFILLFLFYFLFFNSELVPSVDFNDFYFINIIFEKNIF